MGTRLLSALGLLPAPTHTHTHSTCTSEILKKMLSWYNKQRNVLMAFSVKKRGNYETENKKYERQITSRVVPILCFFVASFRLIGVL